MTAPDEGIVQTDNENTVPAVRLLRLADAAKALGVSIKWLRSHRRQLPFMLALSPRVLRVDEAKMIRWLERRRC